jgi:hypothetical protein
MNARLTDVDQLMAAHAAVGGTQPGRRFDVEALNRASVLLLCAHFEGFLEDLMAEGLTAVNGSLDPTALTHSFHNPWPHRIDELFGFLGMRQASHAISWRNAANKTVRDNLSELVRTRNRLAHGTTGVRVYKFQVERFRRYIEGFAPRFDTLVRQRIRRLTGSDPWPP